jgi:cytochrome c2
MKIYILLLSIVVLVYILISQQIYTYKDARGVIREAKHYFDIAWQGEDAYVQKVKETQLSKTLVTPKSKQIIETAVLPLSKTYFYLDSFPSTAGALTTAEGKLLVLDRLGGIYLYKNKKIKKLSFSVPNRLKEFILEFELFGYGGGGRKLAPSTMRAYSIAYDKNTNKVFVSFTRFIDADITRLSVASIKIDHNNFQPISDWRLIFESDNLHSNAFDTHSGGGKILVHNNNLYVTVGYSEFDSKVVNGKMISRAQNDDSTFGKIFKIDLSNGLISQVSKGHRNAQGLTITSDNKLFSTEHGPQGGDEINLIKSKGNYGWPYTTYGTRYGTYDYTWPSYAIDDLELVEPFYSFVPSVATSAIQQINGFNDRWNGDLLVGSLKAQSIYRIKFNNQRVVFNEPIYIGHRIRDIALLDHKIVLLTDDSFLIFLEVDQRSLQRNTKGNGIPSAKLSLCLKCHHLGVTNPSSMAPSLRGIKNKKIGSDIMYKKYSEALKGKEGVWSKDNLISFILEPSKFMPGTSMPEIHITKTEVEEIIKELWKW